MMSGQVASSASTVDSDRKLQRTVLAVTGITALMTTLGTGLVNVANPAIRSYFGVTLGEAGWVVTSYILAVSVLLLIFGRLGDMIGYVKLLLFGLIGFAAASILCSVSTHFSMLILGRLLQGAFAAMLMAMGPPLITTSFPGAQRGRALGVLGTLTYLGLSLGPVVGGILAGRFGWQSVFLVHLPIAAASLVLLRALPRQATGAGAPKKPLDRTSVLTWGLGLSCLLIALSHGERQGWTSRPVVLLVAGGTALLTWFTRRQSRIDNPLLPAPLFRVAAFRNGTIAAVLLYLVSFLMMFVTPFYLRDAWHLSAWRVGILLTIQPAVMTVVAPLSGASADRIGPRVPATAGMVFVAIALLVIGWAGKLESVPLLIVGMAVFGLGAGLFTTANNSGLMGSAPRELQGAASGVLALARNVGMATGVASGSTLYAWFGGLTPSDPGTALIRTFSLATALAVLGAFFSWLPMTQPTADLSSVQRQ